MRTPFKLFHALLLFLFALGMAFGSKFGVGQNIENPVPAASRPPLPATASAAPVYLVDAVWTSVTSDPGGAPVQSMDRELVPAAGPGGQVIERPVENQALPLIIQDISDNNAPVKFLLTERAFFDRLDPASLRINFSSNQAAQEAIHGQAPALFGGAERAFLSFRF